MVATIEEAAKINIKKHKRIYMAKDGTRIKCVHEDGCYPYLATVVGNYDPSLVVELGTSWGGLTKFFEDHAPNALIYSFDKPKPGRKPNKGLFGPRVNFVREDVLIPSDTVRKLLTRTEKKILYCDNGNKVREVLLYAIYLRKGDVLGVHDWPREIYTNYTYLKKAARKHVKPEDVAELSKLLQWFTPVWHEKFLQHGFSTRFWHKDI